jgi:4-hydroxy-tetrahydrodipicolinate synthase
MLHCLRKKELVMNSCSVIRVGCLSVGSRGNDTMKVVEELKQEIYHFLAIFSVSPYYNKPTQEGIYQHFKRLLRPIP